jgi:hypothetical protein
MLWRSPIAFSRLVSSKKYSILTTLRRSPVNVQLTPYLYDGFYLRCGSKRKVSLKSAGIWLVDLLVAGLLDPSCIYRRGL